MKKLKATLVIVAVLEMTAFGLLEWPGASHAQGIQEIAAALSAESLLASPPDFGPCSTVGEWYACAP